MPNLILGTTTVLSESGGTVNLENINLSTGVEVTNLPSGHRPAEVWLSTTTVNSREFYITIPSGYARYKVAGHNLTTSYNNNSLFTYPQISNADDTDMESVTAYNRIESAGGGEDFADGYVKVCVNIGNDATDNLTFEQIWDSLSITRTKGYGGYGFSQYGHSSDQQSYLYNTGFRSQSTGIVNRLRYYWGSGDGSFTGTVVLTGYLGF